MTNAVQKAPRSGNLPAAEAAAQAVAAPREEAPPSPSKFKERVHAIWPAALLIGAGVTVWELFIVVTGTPDYILPPLSKIFEIVIIKAPETFLPNAWVTLQEMLIGFTLGVCAGFSLGTAIFFSSVLRRGLLPFVVASQAVPVIAIAPILIIWFGFGMLPKVLVTALLCFFPLVVNSMAGYASVEREAINLMDSLVATRRQIFFKVQFPAALPFIFTGLRLAAAASAIGAIVGEWVGADKGLGPVIMSANSAFLTGDIFAAIIYLASMAIALFLLVGLAERLIIPWYFLVREKQE